MKKLLAMLGLGCAALLATQVRAQDTYPQKPVKIIVPLAPGGATDIVARVFAKDLSQVLKTPVVVENRTGAGGIIGLEAIAKAPADGYTLFVGNVSTNALNQTIYADKLRAKPEDALQPVTRIATIPHALVASAKFGPKTVAELVTYAKAHPGAVNHASPGVGSYSMLDMLTFEKAADLKMVHVPYNGGAGQFIAPLIANEAQIAFVNISSVLEHVKGGRIQVLAVTTEQRLPELPNVPTLAESGFPNIGTNAWQGLFAPRGLPPAVLDRIFAASVAALDKPDLRQALGHQLIVPAPSKSPAEFDQFVRADIKRWKTVVDTMNVKLD